MTVSADPTAVCAAVEQSWESDVVPALAELIEIPALSPGFDPDWWEHGHLARAVRLVRDWALGRGVTGLTAEVVTLEGSSPVLLIEVPAHGGAPPGDTVLFYGHLDKQPEADGWRADLGPWRAVREGDRLYGRGAVDDGYAVFAVLAAIEAVRRVGGRHARCVGLIETCEESGSGHLPGYLDALAAKIGAPSLVVALDAGAGNYEQLWCTMSLRAVVDVTLRVDVLEVAHHCGMASGIVPSSFRVIRQLLSRLEDERTGALRPEFLHVEIPPERRAQLAEAAADLGDDLCAPFAFAGTTGPVAADPTELLINNTWRPTMAVLAQDGLPPLERKAHVMRTHTALVLSFRFPPGLDIPATQRRLEALLTADPPYGARISLAWGSTCSGWNASPTPPWLERAVGEASARYFGRPARFFGCGGAIPFVNMLGARCPEAQFLITGVAGPGANAHGPNECLDLSAARKLTGCVAHVLDAHASR